MNCHAMFNRENMSNVWYALVSCAPDEIWENERKNVFLSLSEASSPARPSCWGRAAWLSPSSLHSSSPRRLPSPPPPPICPSATSPTWTAKSRCPHWPASTSTPPFRAVTRRPLPPPATRTLSRCCRTVSFDGQVEGPQKVGLTSRFEWLTFCNKDEHIFFAARWN